MAIKLDKASCTVVITCSDCPYWAAVRFGMDEAHVCATNHERVFHPDATKARNAAKVWRRDQRRRAGDSQNLPTPSASFSTWDSYSDSDSPVT